jgi:hypothetical protein
VVGPSTPRAKLRFARGAQRRTAGTPPLLRAGRPLGRNTTSLEGWTPPRVRLRLARGICAPSGRSPHRSRLSQDHRSRTHSPDRSIKCSDTTRASESKAIPTTIRHCVVRPVSAPRHCAAHSRTARVPHPRKLMEEPSKRVRTPVSCSHGTAP